MTGHETCSAYFIKRMCWKLESLDWMNVVELELGEENMKRWQLFATKPFALIVIAVNVS